MQVQAFNSFRVCLLSDEHLIQLEVDWSLAFYPCYLLRSLTGFYFSILYSLFWLLWVLPKAFKWCKLIRIKAFRCDKYITIKLEIFFSRFNGWRGHITHTYIFSLPNEEQIFLLNHDVIQICKRKSPGKESFDSSWMEEDWNHQIIFLRRHSMHTA